MSENELLIEREKLLGRLVEINWYFMAKKIFNNHCQKKKIFNDFGETNHPRSKCFKCHFCRRGWRCVYLHDIQG